MQESQQSTVIKAKRSDGIQAYVGLGANLGHRLGALQDAAQALNFHPKVSKLVASPIYESKAHTLVPGEVQPAYLNAAVGFTTTLGLEDLLKWCLLLESQAGRIRRNGSQWAPRTLDLDVLIYGTTTCQSSTLQVPHPRMARRRFVLRPLFDLAPNLYVPAPFDQTVANLLAQCPDLDVLNRTFYRLLD